MTGVCVQEHAGSVGLETEEVAHPDGHASAAVSLTDDSGKAPASKDLSSSEIANTGPVFSPAASSQPAYDCSTSGDTQISALHSHQTVSAAAASSKEREEDADSKANRPAPSAQPQQPKQGAEQALDTTEAAGPGPSSLASDISQLPDRLRHIRFSGEG